MPTSPSARTGAKAPPQSAPRLPRGLALVGAAALLAVVVIVLPASVALRFLPASIRAEDLSGSLWHGSAGRISLAGRNLGAVEWRLQAWPLLRGAAVAQLHWVRVGFVADGTASLTTHGLTLRDVDGGGPLEDLRDLGLTEGWRGNAAFKFREIKMAFGNGSLARGPVMLESALGDLSLASLSSAKMAEGADLGSYALHVANAAIAPGTDVLADLTDTGGPLEVHATIRISAEGHTGMLSGTIRARPAAAPPLRAQLEQLAQLHARDAQGRIPVELEFTL